MSLSCSELTPHGERFVQFRFDLASLGSGGASFLIRKKFFFEKQQNIQTLNTQQHLQTYYTYTCVSIYICDIRQRFGKYYQIKNIYYANILCPHDCHPKWGYVWIFVIQNNVSRNTKNSSQLKTVS